MSNVHVLRKSLLTTVTLMCISMTFSKGIFSDPLNDDIQEQFRLQRVVVPSYSVRFAGSLGSL